MRSKQSRKLYIRNHEKFDVLDQFCSIVSGYPDWYIEKDSTAEFEFRCDQFMCPVIIIGSYIEVTASDLLPILGLG